MFASHVVHARFACAVPESLFISHEEINAVIVAVLTIRHFVLAEHARRLDEQLPCTSPLELLRRFKSDHLLYPFILTIVGKKL